VFRARLKIYQRHDECGRKATLKFPPRKCRIVFQTFLRLLIPNGLVATFAESHAKTNSFVCQSIFAAAGCFVNMLKKHKFQPCQAILVNDLERSKKTKVPINGLKRVSIDAV